MYSLTSFAWTKNGGNIRGIISNKHSGKTIRGATIKLISFKDKKEVTKTYSKDVGEFIFSNVPPGLYNLECTAFGFETSRVVGLQIHEDRTKLAYIKLERGLSANINEIYTYASLEAKEKALIETGSTNSESLENAPATAYVVTSEEIELNGYMTLSEVLNDIPEIEIQNRSSTGTSNTISIRGVSGNEKLLLLINDVRVNSMASSAISIDYNYNIRYAERIEIILGPASAVYGADAYTGVINIITKEAFNNKSLSISTSDGFYSTTDNSLYIGLGNKDVSFSLMGGLYYSKNPDLFKHYKEDFKWYNDQYSQNGQVINSPFDPNRSTQTVKIEPFNLSHLAYFVNAEFKYKDFLTIGFYANGDDHSSSISTKPEYSPYTSSARYGSITAGFYSTFFYQPKKNDQWSLESTLNIGMYMLPDNSNFANSFSNYKHIYKLGADVGERLQGIFKYKFNRHHKLAVGLNLQHTLALPKTADLPYDLDHNPWIVFDPTQEGIYYPGTNYTDINGNSLKVIQDFYYIRRFMAGAFAEYRINIKDKVLVTLGLRFDQVFDLREYKKNPDVHMYNSFNPRAGIVYKASDNFRIKLFYGEGFLEPSPQKQYEHFGSFNAVQDNDGYYTHLTGGLWRVPNEKLLPEKIRTTELSTRYTKGDFSITTNGYFNRIENALILKTDFENQTFKGIPIVAKQHPMNSNIPVYTYGVTLNTRYKISLGKNEQIGLKFRGSYTYADGRVPRLEHVPFMAKHTIKAGVLFRFKDFSFNNNILYRSASYNDGTQDMSGNYLQGSNPAFAIWNAFIQYKILKDKRLKINIFLKVNNVLNSKYYHVTDHSPHALKASPQDPIRLMLGLTAAFDG